MIFAALAYAQSPSIVQNIRIPLWAELDAYPMLMAEADESSEEQETDSSRKGGLSEQFDYPVKSLKEIVSPEYIKRGIEYSSPWISEGRLNCWCSYRRNEAQIQNYNLWSSIQNPIVQGRGYGSVTLGFEGLKLAANDALKNAIRAYYRNLIKNKPKAITGKVLIRNLPQIGIDSGRYVINLDFFLECGKIIEYEIY